MAKNKNRKINSASLGEDKGETEKLEDKEIKLDEPIAAQAKTESVSLDQSPLLSQGRIERDYASGNSDPDPTPSPETNNGKETEPAEPVYKIQPDAPFDAPEQSFSETPAALTTNESGEGGGDSLDLPDKASKAAANDFTDFILDAYIKLVPEITQSTSKINEKEIRKLEQSGDLNFGSYDLVKAQNKENKQKYKDKANEDAEFIKKPLRKLLQIKQVSAPPHVQLMICLVIILIGQVMLVREIKRENQDLLDKITGGRINRPANAASQEPAQQQEEKETSAEVLIV